jgi:hypothetical protein
MKNIMTIVGENDIATYVKSGNENINQVTIKILKNYEIGVKLC